MTGTNLPKWDFLLTYTNGEQGVHTDLTSASNRKLTISLNDSSHCSFVMSGFSKETALIQELATDVLVSRNGVKLFRGRVGPSTDDVDETGHDVQFSVWDYREMLQRRILLGSERMSWYGIEQERIGWELIEDSQAKDGGDLGITRGTNQTTGVLRDISYDAGTIVGDAVQGLADLQNGFEWEITPDMKYKVYYPLRGNQASKYVLDYGGSVASAKRSVDPSQYANVVRLQGGVPTLPDPPKFNRRTASSAGGFFTLGDTYRYSVAAIMPEGETRPSASVNITMRKDPATGLSSNRANLGWTAVPRATGYNIYGRNLNDGPTNVTAEVSATTGGTIDQLTELKYSVSYTSANGQSRPTEIVYTVPENGSNDNKVKVSWYPRPGATSYTIYGRSQSATPARIATISPIDGNVPIQYFVDTGALVPDGELPDEGFPMQRIATNIQGTTWSDTGLSAPSGLASDGEGHLLTQVRSSGDFISSGTGRIESNVSDQGLLRQSTVDERSLWLLSRKSVVRPSYSLVLAPGKWSGPSDLWVGDRPTLDIVSGRLDVNTQDLRVTEMSFEIDDSGAEKITVVLGYRPRNIFEKVYNSETTINKISRY